MATCMSCISGMQSNPSWSISVKATSPELLKESASANCQAGWHWRERKPLLITVLRIHWGVFSAVVLAMAHIKVQLIKVKGASWIRKRYGPLRRTRSGLHWATAPTGGVLWVWCDHQCQTVLLVALLIACTTLFIQIPSSCSVNFVGVSQNLSPAQTSGTLTPDSSGSIHSKHLRRSSLTCVKGKSRSTSSWRMVALLPTSSLQSKQFRWGPWVFAWGPGMHTNMIQMMMCMLCVEEKLWVWYRDLCDCDRSH